MIIQLTSVEEINILDFRWGPKSPSCFSCLTVCRPGAFRVCEGSDSLSVSRTTVSFAAGANSHSFIRALVVLKFLFF